MRNYTSMAASYHKLATATGDWEQLLKQPQTNLPTLLELRGIEFTKTARFPEAAQAVKHLRTLEHATDLQLYNVACILCRCAKSISSKDGEPLSEEDETQRAQWIDDALEALEQAVEVGYNDADHLQQDADLEILRELPRFKRLVEKLGEADIN